MKRSTAIRHLVEMAEIATDRLRLRPTEIGWPLDEMWATGALLEPADEIDHGTVVDEQLAVELEASKAHLQS